MTTHEPSELDKKTLLKIFRALSDYIAEGGRQGNAHDVARKTLFFIYEGSNSAKKYDRHPKSKKAQNQLSGFNYDHSIPLKCWLQDLIKQCNELSDEQILKEIKLHHHVRIITKDESKKLTKEGLKMRMPSDWCKKKPKNVSREDWINARYQAAGIEF